MRKNFCGFYSLNDNDEIREIWNSNKTVFIFDTNCLLNLYRCEDTTREDILNVMSRISSNIWLPFFVCLEYQKNRRTVITESINSLDQISKSLNAVVTSVTDSLGAGKVKKHLYNSLSDGVHSLQEEIKPLVEKFIREHIEPRINSKNEINKKDIIRDEIDKLVADKCGSLPTEQWIREINSKGDYRYTNAIPPGFLDAKKQNKKHYRGLEFEEKYGDLYIWMEIIEKCKADDIENVIFICDDNKKDWWYEKEGKTHGPLESLQTEIYGESNVRKFKLLNQATFLQDAQEYLSDINIHSESLKEVQDISESTRQALSRRQSQANDHLIQTKHSILNEINSQSIFPGPEYYSEVGNEVSSHLRIKISAHQLEMLNIEILKCYDMLKNVRIRCKESDFDISSLPGDIIMKMDDFKERLYFYKKGASKHLDYALKSSSDYVEVPLRFMHNTKDTLSKCRGLIEHVEFLLDVI
ncbi:PIN-like domain-containing protein [Serratia fonticola]|uniref:PIN like domain-containing protein n=1 Tax=Serratia fonticola TaxID=47917 RepID=A0A448SSU8_SERFO|nr:Uncharacterised protein [Serratia fonticola]